MARLKYTPRRTYTPKTPAGRRRPKKRVTIKEKRAAGATALIEKPTPEPTPEPTKVTDISKIYRGPGTGPGAPVSPLVTHAEKIIKQEAAKKIEDIQKQAFEERLRDPIPTVETEAGRALHKVADPVVKEYEAEIKARPTKHVVTTFIPPEEHVPTPYVPGTLPEDVEYGERPKFDQPQVHEILKEKILGAEAIWSRIGDPLGLRHRQLPFTVPFFGTPEEQAEMAEKQIEMAPGAVGEAAIAYTGGYVLGAATKAGVLGARYVTGLGASKIAPKVPEAFKIRKAVLGAERVIEPGVGVVFGAAVAKDLAETPKEELTEKIMALAVGFVGAEKGYRAPEKFIDIFRTRGKIEVPVEAIIEPPVLLGKEPFPYMKPGETPAMLMRRFREPEYKLPEDIPGALKVWHATAKAFPEKATIKPGVERPSDLPGLYVAPSVSPHFLRTGQIKPKDMPKPSYLERFFGQQESLTPTLLRVEVPLMERLPPSVRQSLLSSKIHMESPLHTGKAIISRDVELARGRTVEAEAIITQRTEMSRAATEHYVMVGDRRVPIDEYIVTTKLKYTKKPTFEEKKAFGKELLEKMETGELEKIMSSSMQYIGKPTLRAKPDPYYYIPKRPRKYKPYYRDDAVPSEYVAPISEIPVIPSKYVPPTPSEYISPRPREEISPRPREYVPPTPSEYISPRPREEISPRTREYVVPHISSFVPPVPIPTMKIKPVKPKKVPIKDKRRTPGYAWHLANPIATLEQLMGGRQAPRTAPRTSKKKSNTTRRRK